MRLSYPSLSSTCHTAVLRAPSGVRAANIAGSLGIPYPTLMADLTRQERHRLDADLVLPLMDATGSLAPLEFLAREMRCACIPIPASPVTEGTLTDQTIEAMGDFGELLTAVRDSLLDGKLTRTERELIASRGHRTVTAIMQLLQSVNETQE